MSSKSTTARHDAVGKSVGRSVDLSNKKPYEQSSIREKEPPGTGILVRWVPLSRTPASQLHILYIYIYIYMYTCVHAIGIPQTPMQRILIDPRAAWLATARCVADKKTWYDMMCRQRTQLQGTTVSHVSCSAAIYKPSGPHAKFRAGPQAQAPYGALTG